MILIKAVIISIFILLLIYNNKIKSEASEAPDNNRIILQAIPNTGSILGDAPHWDAQTQSLYFVDSLSSTVFRYDFRENKTYRTKIANVTIIGFITPIDAQPNHFAVGINRRVAILRWDGRSPQSQILNTIFELDKEPIFQTNRIKLAKADPRGRFFGGTMRTILPQNLTQLFYIKHVGNFYSWEKGGQPKRLLSNIGISSGLTWNTNTRKFYYIDSFAMNIKEYNYNINTGDISSPRVVINFRINGKYPKFVPDGMTIDNSGFLFVAAFNASKVFKIDPRNGKIEQRIDIPTAEVTSVAFGGPNLDILFVTTAKFFNQPSPAGQVFKITGLGTKGLNMFKLKV